MLLAASVTLTPFSVNNFYLEKAENEEMRRIEQACPIRRATAGAGRRWAHIEKQPHDDENHAVAYSIASLYMPYTQEGVSKCKVRRALEGASEWLRCKALRLRAQGVY